MSLHLPTTRRTALAALASSCLALPRPSLAAGDIAGIVEAAFRPLLAEHDIPGLAVGVTVDGLRHVACWGVAARGEARPVTPATLFEVGSLSKAYTATLGALAVARGRMALSDHPGRFLPALRGAPVDAATLLDLCTYTAGGLPLQVPDAVTDAGLLAWLRDWAPSAAPGRVRRYSNPSIGLFGLVAARALGRDFTDLAQGELFPALGLGRTFLRVPEAAMADYAWGHRGGQLVRVSPGVLDAQAYGVKTTAADLLRFVEANLQPQGLAPALRQAIEATHAGWYGVGPMVQGLGWEQYPFPVPLPQLVAGNAPAMALEPQPVMRLPGAMPAGPTLFNKTGSTNGFGAYAAFVPARRLGLVMLANRNIPNEARVRAGHAVLHALAAG